MPNSVGPRPRPPLDNNTAFLFSSTFNFISGASPMTRPGPPPPAVVPRPSVPPSNLASNKPYLPPPGTQSPMPFGSSPPPPGSLPSAMSSSVLALSVLGASGTTASWKPTTTTDDVMENTPKPYCCCSCNKGYEHIRGFQTHNHRRHKDKHVECVCHNMFFMKAAREDRRCKEHGHHRCIFSTVLGFGINIMTLVMIIVLGITKRTAGGTGRIYFLEMVFLHEALNGYNSPYHDWLFRGSQHLMWGLKCSELEQDEVGLSRSSSDISTSESMSTFYHGDRTVGCYDNGSVQGLHSASHVPLNGLTENALSHGSSCVPNSLPSPLRVASAVNHLGSHKSHHSVDQVKSKCIPSFHPHSFLDCQDNFNISVPHNSSSTVANMAGKFGSRVSDGMNGRHISMVGSNGQPMELKGGSKHRDYCV
ncbi:unnamed protein product [Camellia sinensis]